MNNDNPYRAPTAAVADVPLEGAHELAGRGHRFGASIIDGIIEVTLFFVIAYAVGIYSFDRDDTHEFLFGLLTTMLGFAVFAVVHSYFLMKNGQTIGKKIVGIRVVDLDGNVPGLLTLLGRRYAPIYAAEAIPLAGGLLPLIDVLFIFREDRRCIHDLIAKTRVVLSGAKYSSTTWIVAPTLLVVVLGIGASIIIPPLFEHSPKPTRAAPAKPATPATKQQPAQSGAKTAPPAPAATGSRPAPPAANAAPAANTGTPSQGASNADLRKCLELKDPAAVARCSGNIK